VTQRQCHQIRQVAALERSARFDVAATSLSLFGAAVENSTGRVLTARQVELPIMAYNDRCGSYDQGTMQPGMLCAGYADGDHDTCQVQSTVQFIVVITVVIIYHARSSKTLESEVEKNTTKQSPITNYNLNEKQS